MEWFEVKGYEDRYVMTADAEHVVSLGACVKCGWAYGSKGMQKVVQPKALRCFSGSWRLSKDGSQRCYRKERLRAMLGKRIDSPVFWTRGYLNDLRNFR